MGVQKQLLRPGNGPKPVPGQSVTVHCTGYGKNGDLSQKFWSTKDPGQNPFTFKIGQGSVIKGWDEGVLGMQVGEVARLQNWQANIAENNPSPTRQEVLRKKSPKSPRPHEKDRGERGTFIEDRRYEKLWIDVLPSFYMPYECSPDYAYGANGFPAWGIQPNSVLVFEIEVLSAK